MRITKSLGVISIAAFLGAGWLQLQGSSPAFAQAAAATPKCGGGTAIRHGPCLRPPQDFDRFTASVVATFVGTTSKQGLHGHTDSEQHDVTVGADSVGTLSVFGFKTAVPIHMVQNGQVML